MLEISSIKNVYMLGIGGISMSALARYFHEQGAKVSGYDKTETELTKQLQKEGIHVHYNEAEDAVDTKADTVIYSSAIPNTQAGLLYYQKKKHPHILKRKEALGLITRNLKAICFAGTHGKTTMSIITSYLLRETGVGGCAFLGGISSNYNTNYWSIGSSPCVVEADEYDRSFLELNPYIGVISSMDADHLDIYGNVEQLRKSYIAFSNLIQDDGILIYHQSLPLCEQLGTQLQKRYSYHISNSDADIHASNIQTKSSGYVFDFHMGSEYTPNCFLPFGGKHNVENALVAIAISHLKKITGEKIKSALEGFKGIKRRFEIVYQKENCAFINDYAHHPSELNSLIRSAKSMFPKNKILLIFQPHLYSRTRDFANLFAQELDNADSVILLDIYPARENPISDVSSEIIRSKMKNAPPLISSMQDTLKQVANLDKSVSTTIILAGAGDIDNLTIPIKNILQTAK